MYCHNCGKEISKAYKFCEFCGTEIKASNTKLEEFLNIEEKNNKTFSMKWYNFFNRIVLPIITIINLFFICLSINSIINNFNFASLFFALIEIALYIIIPIVLYDKMISFNKTGFALLMIYFVIDYLLKTITTSIDACVRINDFSQFTIYFIFASLIYAIWFLPNIIYFYKRKSLFGILGKSKDKTTEQYFKIIKILLIIFIIFLTGLVVFTFYSKYKSMSNQISSLESTISNLEKDKIDLSLDSFKKSREIKFLEDKIAIIPSNSKTYHKYGCEYLDTSSFIAFNKETAIVQGYTPCSHCIE